MMKSWKIFLLIGCLFMSANQLVYSNEMDEVEQYDDIEDPEFERTAWKGTFNAPYSSLEEAENKIILLSQYPYNKTRFAYYDEFKYRYSEGYADYERVILDKAIYMDWENKQIYIPQVQSREEEYNTEEYFVTGRYDCYYFNGEVFEYKDTQENLFFLTTN